MAVIKARLTDNETGKVLYEYQDKLGQARSDYRGYVILGGKIGGKNDNGDIEGIPIPSLLAPFSTYTQHDSSRNMTFFNPLYGLNTWGAGGDTRYYFIAKPDLERLAEIPKCCKAFLYFVNVLIASRNV